MVFKGKEFGEEEKKERTSICEFCLMISIPLRALETHQPSSRPASAVCPKVLHLRSYINCLVVLHWPSSGPTSAVQRSCINCQSSSSASAVHPAVLHQSSNGPASPFFPGLLSGISHHPHLPVTLLRILFLVLMCEQVCSLREFSMILTMLWVSSAVRIVSKGSHMLWTNDTS